MRVSLRTLPGTALLALMLAPSLADAQTIPSPYSFFEARQETGPVIGYMSTATGRFGYGPPGGSCWEAAGAWSSRTRYPSRL